jgi:hypothetical protein
MVHNIDNLSVQSLFICLHDAILFQDYGNSQTQDLQLGVFECKVYHDALMNTKSHVNFDFLSEFYMLDKTEENVKKNWHAYALCTVWKFLLCLIRNFRTKK